MGGIIFPPTWTYHLSCGKCSPLDGNWRYNHATATFHCWRKSFFFSAIAIDNQLHLLVDACLKFCSLLSYMITLLSYVNTYDDGCATVQIQSEVFFFSNVSICLAMSFVLLLSLLNLLQTYRSSAEAIAYSDFYVWLTFRYCL